MQVFLSRFAQSLAPRVHATLLMGQGTSDADATALTPQTVAVTDTVNSYAAPRIVASAGTLTRIGTGYALDLGTMAPGSAPVQVSLRNAAAGPADLLAGSFALQSGATGFDDTGFATLSGLAAGTQALAGTVAVDPANAPGTYTETFTLTSTGSNDSGLPTPEMLTVTERP